MDLSLGLGLGAPAVLRRRGPTWTPEDLPGEDIAWWSAKDVTGVSIGATVSTVPARLGGVEQAQPVSSARPTYQEGINGFPSLLLASDDFLRADARAAGYGGDDTPFSWFGAISPTLGAAIGHVISIGNSGNLLCAVPFRVWNAGTQAIRIDGSQHNASAGVVLSNTPVVAGVVFFGTTVDFWIDGIKVADSVALNSDTIGTTNRRTIGALGRSNTTGFYNGYWGEEFETVGVAVDDETALAASKYLMREWGI